MLETRIERRARILDADVPLGDRLGELFRVSADPDEGPPGCSELTPLLELVDGLRFGTHRVLQSARDAHEFLNDYAERRGSRARPDNPMTWKQRRRVETVCDELGLPYFVFPGDVLILVVICLDE